MKKLHLYLILPAFLGSVFIARGQTPEATYMQQAGINSVLYRGALQPGLPFRYNGSIFAYQDAFTTGDLWYNHKFYGKILLNLDAFRDALYIKLPEGLANIILEKELVEKFTMDGKSFINIPKPSPYPNLPSGFFQVLHNGTDMLLKKIKKEYLERPIDVDNRGIYRFFEESVSYYIVKGGVAYPAQRPKSCLKIYKEQKNEIQKFLKTNNLRTPERKQFDSVFQQVMQFIDGKKPEQL